ncbi:GNAT family N-acetyltransferase [Amycolatopsis minnesotensis]|uniref:GNAT family N-acetyltransferase n=1 Tax=Amycolatopsis minnesotensis TaxID=337894 RepID=UPI0031CE952F
MTEQVGMVEEIRTPRLLLRPLRESDRARSLEIQLDPRANRFTPESVTREQAREKFTGWLTHWAHHGFGYFAIIEAETGEFLGTGGVQYRDFGGEDVLNLYYRVKPSAWGNGYATEAATAAVDWAERSMPDTPVVISVAIGNHASIRVAERLGFTRYSQSLHHGLYSRHYRR